MCYIAAARVPLLPLVCHIRKSGFLALLHSTADAVAAAAAFAIAVVVFIFILQWDKRNYNAKSHTMKIGIDNGKTELTELCERHEANMLDKLLPKQKCHHPKWIGIETMNIHAFFKQQLTRWRVERERKRAMGLVL